MQVNSFDAVVIHFLNQFAQKSWLGDHLISAITDNSLLTGGFMMSLFWWAWFRSNDEEEKDRRLILSTIFFSSAALFLARALALLLPFRERPLRNPMLHFRPPIGEDPQTLLGWSAFPSDHAVLFFALATSVFLLSRKVGILALSYSFIVVCLPRIYMGHHYPTDILAGALLGSSVAYLSRIRRLSNLVSSLPMRWFERSPASFYPCLFLVTYLFGTMFQPLISIVIDAGNASRYIMHRAWF